MGHGMSWTKACLAVGLLVSLVIGTVGCSAVDPPTSREAAVSAGAENASGEAGDVGVCHSVSLVMTMLEKGSAEYSAGALDRSSFTIVAGDLADSLRLLRIMHSEATLIPAVDSLRSAIGELATVEGAPQTGDGSPVARSLDPIVKRCDEIDAPVSISQ